MFIETLPVGTFGAVFSTIIDVDEVTLMKDSDWLTRISDDPILALLVEHVLDHLSLTCTVASTDSEEECFTVLDREVDVHT